MDSEELPEAELEAQIAKFEHIVATKIKPAFEQSEKVVEGYVRRRDEYQKLLSRLESIRSAEDGKPLGTNVRRLDSATVGGAPFKATKDELDAIHVLPKELGRPAETLAEVGEHGERQHAIVDTSKVIVAIGLGILVELDARSEAPAVVREQVQLTNRLIIPLQRKADAHRERLAKAEAALDSLRDTRREHPLGSDGFLRQGAMQAQMQSAEAAAMTFGWTGQGEEEGEGQGAKTSKGTDKRSAGMIGGSSGAGGMPMAGADGSPEAAQGGPSLHAVLSKSGTGR